MEFAYILTVKVAPKDADLLESKVAGIIRDRFEGTAIGFVECFPLPADKQIISVAQTEVTRLIWQAGYDKAIREIAEG